MDLIHSQRCLSSCLACTEVCIIGKKFTNDVPNYAWYSAFCFLLTMTTLEVSLNLHIYIYIYENIVHIFLCSRNYEAQ